jgi:hypothetical protein
MAVSATPDDEKYFHGKGDRSEFSETFRIPGMRPQRGKRRGRGRRGVEGGGRAG